MLSRIIYVSDAASAGSDLAAIVASARRNNPAEGITGAICYLDGRYLQYLEGRQRALAPLFDRIRLDHRHTELTVLDQGTIATRLFSHKAMGLLEWTEEGEALFKAFAPGRKPDLRAPGPANVAPLFRALSQSFCWE